MSTVTLPEGKIKRIHVNRQRIDANRKYEEDAPTITVKCGGKNYYGHTVEIVGLSRLSQRDPPLSCGARVYLTTTGQVCINDE